MKSYPFEKAHLKFLKYHFSLEKQFSPWVILGETGRTPFLLDIFRRTIKFWFHCILSPSPIVRASLDTSASLAANKHKSWFFYLNRMLQFTKMSHILYTFDPDEVKKATFPIE